MLIDTYIRSKILYFWKLPDITNGYWFILGYNSIFLAFPINKKSYIPCHVDTRKTLFNTTSKQSLSSTTRLYSITTSHKHHTFSLLKPSHQWPLHISLSSYSSLSPSSLSPTLSPALPKHSPTTNSTNTAMTCPNSTHTFTTLLIPKNHHFL